jgi:hypothetical protein
VIGREEGNMAIVDTKRGGRGESVLSAPRISREHSRAILKARAEISGPTAVIKSVSKLEHILESGGSILNLKFNPSIFTDSRKIDNLVSLVRAFFELKGMEVQNDIIARTAHQVV